MERNLIGEKTRKAKLTLLYKYYLKQAGQNYEYLKAYHENEHDNSGGHPDYHNNTHDNTPGKMMMKRKVKNVSN